MITLAAGLALLAAAVAASVLNHRLDQQREAATALPVRVALATSGPATTTVRFTALARAPERRAAAFTLGGRLEERRVRVGDRLEPGAVVARLDPRPLAAARDGARARCDEIAARLDQARRDQARAEALVRAEAIGREQAERLRAEVAALVAAADAAGAALREAERQCGEAVLRAPWPALVSAVEAEPGEVVAPGQAVLRLERALGSEVPVAVPPALLPRLAADQAVEVLPFGGAALPGRIVSIAAAADRSRLCEVLVATAATIAPGSAATVAIALPEPAAVSVPVTALLDRQGRPAVLVVAHGSVRRLPVTLAAIVGERALVAGDGLAPGMEVAVSGHERLGDGQAVEVDRGGR